MATMSISTNLKKQILYTMFYYTPGYGKTAYSFGNGDQYFTGSPNLKKSTFCIMKGTVPTDFSALTTPTSRSTDVLITMQDDSSTSTIGLSNPIGETPGRVDVNSQFVNATASGQATWFWWYITGYTTNTIVQQIVGTVGTSGADLIIPDTNIVAGDRYKFINLSFTMTDTFTY